MKDKNDIITDLKQQIYVLDKNNTELSCKNKNL